MNGEAKIGRDTVSHKDALAACVRRVTVRASREMPPVVIGIARSQCRCTLPASLDNHGPENLEFIEDDPRGGTSALAGRAHS